MDPLTVFPNTGHHVFVIPLAELLPKQNEQFLEKLVLQNRGPFEVWSYDVPWVRYQYDLTPRENKPVMKIALESNLGLPTRGFLYDVEEVDAGPVSDETISPYAARDEAEIERCYPRRLLPLLNLPSGQGSVLPVDLKICFAKKAGEDPIDVDLVVDLGNTRTAAVLLEAPGPEGVPLEQRIWPVRVLPRGNQFDMTPAVSKLASNLDKPGYTQDDCAIIDSWLLLHQTLFAHLEPPLSNKKSYEEYAAFQSQIDAETRYRRIRYLPHAFVELSPALIGGGKSLDGAAKTFARIPLNSNNRFYLSSPKRYVWDNELQGYEGGLFWQQIPNPAESDLPFQFVELSGMFRFFMDPSGCDWDIDHPPRADDFRGVPFVKRPPSYPRRAAVCWFALSLIEAAYRQMNSPAYLKATGRNTLPRRLRNIHVTYPAGWTSEELHCYYEEWERAIKLFTMTHLEDTRPVLEGGQRPRLEEKHIDEAVCAQLPLMYAQIQTLFRDGVSWIDLYGSDGRIVVMNLDIGGGTSDLAIIQYRNSSTHDTVSLKSQLLFRDGHNIAGDMLVKAIIEKVLLPTWVKASDQGQYQTAPQAMEWLKIMFKSPTLGDIRAVEPFVRQKLVRIIRLVFVPLINELLQRLANFAESPDSAWEPLDIKACETAELIDSNTLNDLNELCSKVIKQYCPKAQWRSKVFANDARLMCDPKQINQCIEDVFSDMFNSLGELAARFKCQLLIVSGKPSELPKVRELLLAAFPLLPQRIIQVKNFPAGRWYPFATPEGKIKDAKTCTVVGAALYQDICNGNLQGFSIQPQAKEAFSRDYYWGIIPSGGLAGNFFKGSNQLFSPREYPTSPNDSRRRDCILLEKDFDLPMNCRIGRQVIKMKGVRPNQVYELVWKPREIQTTEQVVARVRLRWVSVKGEGEHLELVNVTPKEGYHPVAREEVKLRLKTLADDSFWMDDPMLDADTLFAYKQPAAK